MQQVMRDHAMRVRGKMAAVGTSRSNSRQGRKLGNQILAAGDGP